MTIDEARALQAKLAADMTELVRTFEGRTGCVVTQIDTIQTHTLGGYDKTQAIEIHVKLNLAIGPP